MKRYMCAALALLFLFSLCACQKAPTVEPRDERPEWKVQYDLGVRYLSEGNYEEAIIAFTAAIEIDPKQPKIYDRLATAYELAGDDEAALRTLLDGAAATGDRALAARAEEKHSVPIVAVAAGWAHTVGLRANGTVVAVGYNEYGQCDVSDWTDIVAVAAGSHHTVGLKADGTVIAVGENEDGQCDVSGWRDIVAVAAEGFYTVGLKSDGTVVAVGSNYYGQCEVSDWRDIVAASAGGYHAVGLKADGTVVAVGDNEYGQCDVSGWRGIVAVAAGDDHTADLKTDGTAMAGTPNTIAAGGYHTVGLRADSTVAAAGWNDDGQCDVSGWANIRIPTAR